MNLFDALRDAWNSLVSAGDLPEPDAPDGGWGRFPERLSDGRGAQTHLKHL